MYLIKYPMKCNINIKRWLKDMIVSVSLTAISKKEGALSK